MTYKREIRITADGSSTLFIPELDENYHSTHGAIQEAEHVFIKHGLNFFPAKSSVNILEIGFGTGLNALLTLKHALKEEKLIHYTGIEAFPVETDLIKQINYVEKIENGTFKNEFDLMHSSTWNVTNTINPFLKLLKKEIDFKTYLPEKEQFDLIYFDAFGPRAQEEMWNKIYFERLYASLKENGFLVTYCAKGQVKRDLKACGFIVETLPGPPGKREMTRAVKIKL